MNGGAEGHEEEPADVRALAIQFGISRARLDVIERLAHGPATMAELGLACGFTRHGVEPHLALLEAIGLVTWTVVRLEGVCRPTRRYVLDQARLEDLRWALHDVLDFAEHDSRKQSA